MLIIVTGDYRDFESDSHFYYHLGNYFQAMYEDAWFLDSFAERVIKDVDHVDLEGRGVDALWANRIPPDRISGGSQTLLCLRHTNIWTSLSRMGENCYKFLQELAQQKNIRVAATTYYAFSQEDLSYGPVWFERSQRCASNEFEFAMLMGEEFERYVSH